jgi:Zn-dependent protease with chaperone function
LLTLFTFFQIVLKYNKKGIAVSLKLIIELVLTIMCFSLIYGQENQAKLTVDNCQKLSSKLTEETYRSLIEYNYRYKPTEVKPEFNPQLHAMVQDIASKMGIKEPSTQFFHFDKPNAASIESFTTTDKHKLAIDPRLITQGGEHAYEYTKFVLAHEMAHLHYKHGSLKKKRDEEAAIKLFATVPIVSLGNALSRFGLCKTRSPIMTAALLTSYGLINGYQAFTDAKIARQEEIEADLKALEITKDASAAINLFQGFAADRKKAQILPKLVQNLVDLFKDHPTYEERITYLSTNLNKEPKGAI